MKTPTEHEIEQLMHFYDPVKAHEYYIRTRKLKGRKTGLGDIAKGVTKTSSSGRDPRRGKTRKQISKDARAKQRKELSQAIDNLEDRLRKLEQRIKKEESKEASENRKGKAKKERAAKENTKPKSVAEKSKESREARKYRDKNQQKLKTNAKKDGKSGGGSSKGKGKTAAKKRSVSELKTLATKVRGQISIAKAKLAAL
jgi:hypothetical protein